MFGQVTLHRLYLAYYLDRVLLAAILTLCSGCHELNESCVYVWVFQDTGVYGVSASQLLELGVSEFCLCSQTHV